MGRTKAQRESLAKAHVALKKKAADDRLRKQRKEEYKERQRRAKWIQKLTKNREELRRSRGQPLSKEEVRDSCTTVDTDAVSPTLHYSIPVM